jgi:hypothetical protein
MTDAELSNARDDLVSENALLGAWNADFHD